MSEPPDSPDSPDSPARRARRSREEIEALAKDFTAAPGAVVTVRGMSWIMLAVLGVGVLGAVIWLLLPTSEPVRDRAALAPAPDVTLWKQKLEAERERAKKKQGGSDYFARTAAAEGAMLRDLTASAERLANVAESVPPPPVGRRAEAAPAAKASAPAASAAAPATVQKPAPVPGQAASAPAEHRTAAPSASAPEPAPATAAASAAPAPTAARAPPSAEEVAKCRIHVSELSSSGKLTHADIARMKGAHVDERTGHAFTPPIALKGRTVVFDVAPNGCVTIARSSLNR